MKQKLLKISFLFFVGIGMSFAQTLTNVALGGTVTVTDENSTLSYVGNETASGWTNQKSINYPGNNAVDGVTDVNDNRWIWRFDGVDDAQPANQDGINVSMTIAFDAAYKIASYKFIEGTTTSADFTIDYWNGGAWQNVVTVTENPTSPLETAGTFTAVTTDQVKITWTAHNDAQFMRMYEIEIYEAFVGTDGDEEIVSSIEGVLDNGANTISDLSPGQLAAELIAGVSLNQGVIMELFEADGVTPVDGTTFITTGMKLVTTSPFDGDIRTYTLSSTTLTNVAEGKAVETTLVHAVYQGTEPAGGDEVLTDGILKSDGTTDVNRYLIKLKDNGDNPSAAFEIDLGVTHTISKYAVYTTASNSALNFSKQVSDFVFEYWDGAAYQLIEEVTGNSDASYFKSFAEVSTDKVRLTVTNGVDGFARLTEVQVFGNTGTAGVNDFILNKVSLYPNPVLGNELTIDSLQEINSLKVYNILGKQMKTSFTGKNVDVSNLNSGIYIIKVNNKNTIKFIKQ